MRLFLIGWGDTIPETVDVVLELKKKHEIVYWTRCRDLFPVDANQFPGTIIHEIHDALFAIPAPDVDSATYDPPSQSLIKQFYETEVIVLSMMNKKYEWMGVDERKHLYYKLLQYWHGVIEEYRPDAMIFPAIPHTVYDFVIYAIARAKGIKTILLEATWVNDRLVCMNDFTVGSSQLERAQANNQGKIFTVEELSEDLREYYRVHTSAMDATPGFMKNTFAGNRGVRLLKKKSRMICASVKHGTLLKNAWSFVMNRLHGNLKSTYERLALAPDWQRPYVYVPLHFQPERTTSPQGGVFVDQLLMVEMLSKSLPSGWLLFVKEHPTEWVVRGPKFFSYRYRGYYEAMAALPNVRFVPIATDTYTLLAHAKAVATVSGTAGWEGILRKKPVVVFGFPWYQHCEGVIKVNDVQSARAAFDQIVNGFAPNPEGTIRYLKSLDQASVKGCMEEYARQISSLSVAQNKENLTQMLLEILEENPHNQKRGAA